MQKQVDLKSDWDSLLMTDETNRTIYKNIAQLTRLSAAQIRVAVTESGDNVDSLTQSFREIVSQDKLIRDKIEQLPDDSATQQIKDDIAIISTELRANINDAVVAFQFYDRLCQRLDHTSECLRNLSEIEDHELQSSEDELIKLRDNVYNHFTMIEERQLFDAILSSKDFEQAIKDYSLARKESIEEESDDIELF
ncbi:MAG: hypothetical protein ACI9IA_001347 [Enterobacterales bacterium]|jgi:hypothetical protein